MYHILQRKSDHLYCVMGIASLSLVGKIVRSIDGFCMKWLSKSVILKSQNKYIYR